MIDAPVTTALEHRYGGGTVALIATGAPMARAGIENLTLESEFDAANPRDEEHSWIAVALDRVEDAWVRGVVARHFAGSAVRVGPRARRITIEACRSEQPVSEPGGYRRQSFLVEGQQVLVRQCWSEQGMNDFAAGLLAAGPNVFLDSTATRALGPSGPFESWASGVLYERVRVEGSGIRLTADSSRSQGAGWTAANSVIWNCDAKDIEARGPEGADNMVNRSPEPLYESQLARRTGGKLTASRSPPPRRRRIFRSSIPGRTRSRRLLQLPVQIVNGRFVAGGKVLWGGAVNDGWWRGQAIPAAAVDAGGIALTRFVPGRTGPGLTEDLPALAARMVAQGTPFYQSIPGLWYDRRRDEHSIASRTDGNVWAPFYEMPWARSGTGTAADGLSQFDLSRFNNWYYERFREFGQLCDRNGLVLYHNLYNTHNTLEIPPHWIDYPWRPANNINNTGLPEPPPIEPGNHLHVANEVYDVSNPVRRALHRAFILHELDQLGETRNLFFCLGAQFAGPLSFQEFFQDTVAEWEKKTGRTVRIQLATSKDITDAILADPVRARQVAVIDMRYWQYKPDGSLWAPPGRKNLAFREMIAKDFGQIGRRSREYHAAASLPAGARISRPLPGQSHRGVAWRHRSHPHSDGGRSASADAQSIRRPRPGQNRGQDHARRLCPRAARHNPHEHEAEGRSDRRSGTELVPDRRSRRDRADLLARRPLYQAAARPSAGPLQRTVVRPAHRQHAPDGNARLPYGRRRNPETDGRTLADPAARKSVEHYLSIAKPNNVSPAATARYCVPSSS